MTGFLFDENLPAVADLGAELPVVHATALGERLSDSALWAHAKQNDLVIVTKDADFSQRIILTSPPPRVVHLRIGNMRRRDFESWLRRVWPRIEAFAKDHKLVNVFEGFIQAVR